MTKVNHITFDIDTYDNNRAKMFQAIGKQLDLLTENEYVCKVYYDDCGIFVIEFELDQRETWLGAPELMWLNEDEVKAVERFREEADMNDCKSNVPDESGDGNTTTCDCYHTEYGRPQCWGTKARSDCTCGGDERECDFYPEERNNTK